MFLEIGIVLALLNDPKNPEASSETHCLIENAIYESLGEGEHGMRLVTEVVINRVDSGFRNTNGFCETIYDPFQFSWTRLDESRLYQYTEEDYLRAARVVLSVMYDEVDRILPRNTLHFINTRIASDLSWYDSRNVVYRYGNHQFLSNVR